MDKIYVGAWSSKEEMAKEFSNDYKEPLDKAIEADVLFPAYYTGIYEGEALVLFRERGKLFEVHASHCSCFGLEGQWEPEEIDPDQLLARIERASRYGIESAHKDEIKSALGMTE